MQISRCILSFKNVTVMDVFNSCRMAMETFTLAVVTANAIRWVH